MKHQHHNDAANDQVNNQQSDATGRNGAEALQEEITGLRAQLSEKEEQLLRAKADLQNVRRRAEDERLHLPKLGAVKIFQSLLPTLDHIELALKNKPAEETDWIRGVESIYSALFSALQAEGIERIDQTGIAIDPMIHEVIVMDGDTGDVVTDILQSGYQMHGKVIRPAKVKAGGKVAEETNSH